MLRKKIIGIVLCMLLITTTFFIVSEEKNVKAESESGGDSSDFLNYTYLWEQIGNYTDVIYKAYNDTDIRKGRLYGSKGGIYAANLLWNELFYNLTLENVDKDQIKYIDDDKYKEIEYSTLIDVIAYNLTINSDTYQYSPFIPPSEFYPIVSARKKILTNFTYNSSFENANLFYNNLRTLFPENVFNYSYTITNFENSVNPENEILWGKMEYLTVNQTPPSDSEQQGVIYLLDDDAENQNLLDNLTDARGCILIDSLMDSVINYTKSSMVVKKINQSDGNNIKEILENYSDVHCNNVSENITLYYDLNVSWFPSNDFFVIDRVPDHFELQNDTSRFINKIAEGSGYPCPNLMAYWGCVVYWTIFYLLIPRCQGILLYSSYDYYNMPPTMTKWGPNDAEIDGNRNAFMKPALWVNYSLGNHLNETRDSDQPTTISGYIDQKYFKQTEEEPGVRAYNVLGEINIQKSPNDERIILSNRYDGMWGQTPGDSGIGTAIVLALAKQLKTLQQDYSVNPKYNITFLFTTGEEYGFRGAQYAHDKMDLDGTLNKLKLWIGFDQLGMKQTDVDFAPQFGGIMENATIHKQIFWALTNQTNYETRNPNNIQFEPGEAGVGEGCEWEVWGNNTDPKIDCIQFVRDNKYRRWDQWHATGNNYIHGDSLDNTDSIDTNLTFELAWNITRYYILNPDCWFDDITYEDINMTGGTAPDSLKTTYTVKSVLPNDIIMIQATFYDSTGTKIDCQFFNITINRTGITQNITFNLPSGINEGDYNVTIKVFNSTARINSLTGLTYCANDTGMSPKFHLNRYHTLGDICIGSSNENVHNIILGSKYTPTENALVQNITAYITGVGSPPQYTPTYQCMIYRFSDGHLMGATAQIDKKVTGWYTFNFNPKPILQKNTEYILSIWGDNAYSTVYYNDVYIGNGYSNTSCTFGTPPQTIEWIPFVTLRQYSIFCNYVLDTYPPEIINESHSPDTVGFGYNVTIHANVSDNISGVNTVKINISYPDQTYSNYTMSHISGDRYRYVFNNTWLIGQYNYTIWAYDNSSNSNSSTGHHFNVSANASITIATLKDHYTGNEYINITDPPNPPENYTLINRGLDWDKYYNAVTGDSLLEISAGPINYQNETYEWTPINTTLQVLDSDHPAYQFGYRAGNDRGLYNVFFKPNIQQNWPVAFAYNKSDDPTVHVLRTSLVGVGYLDPSHDWDHVILQNVQSSQGLIDEDSITYENVFTGVDVMYSYRNADVKEEIILSNTTKEMLQNHPPSLYGLDNKSSYLVFVTKLDYKNLTLYNTTGILTANFTTSEGYLEFRDTGGRIKAALPIGETYEQYNETVRHQLTYRIIQYNGNTYLLSGIRVADLNNMTFPVVIDPTLTLYSTTSDGRITASSEDYATAHDASSGSVINLSPACFEIGQKYDESSDPPFYQIWRGFVFFNTSAIPSNTVITNATVSLYKYSDYSNTDFNLTIQNGQPVYPHDPLQGGDYNKNYYAGDGGSFNTSGFSNGYNNISMTNLSWINKTGMTKMCLRSSRDIHSTVPLGNEYIRVYASEAGSGFQPKLVVTYRNQSKIKNTGTTNISGYLLIQVQFYNTSQGKWIVDNDTVNETTPRTILRDDQLALDTIFNGLIRASDLINSDGTYRVYAAFRNPTGEILVTDDEQSMSTWYSFTYTEDESN